jgi:hypothetical protein
VKYPFHFWKLVYQGAEAKTIIENALKLLKTKQKAGFKGLRVATKMGIFLENAKEKELLKYETTLGKKLDFEVCALCMYDTAKLDETQLVQRASTN